MSADLLLPWPVVAAPVSAGATRKKLEIQTQLKVGIKQMSECLGDARYSKSIYALLSRSIVRSLLRYRVRDNDHYCVLCDVTLDLLFTWYIVHQPNMGVCCTDFFVYMLIVLYFRLEKGKKEPIKQYSLKFSQREITSSYKPPLTLTKM